MIQSSLFVCLLAIVKTFFETFDNKKIIAKKERRTNCSCLKLSKLILKIEFNQGIVSLIEFFSITTLYSGITRYTEKTSKVELKITIKKIINKRFLCVDLVSSKIFCIFFDVKYLFLSLD